MFNNKIGTRLQVMNGTAKQTGGGLKRKDLKYNTKGKIVSKRLSNHAKKRMTAQYGGQNSSNNMSSQPAFVMFYAPWCGYCKETMPKWKKIENMDLKDSKNRKVKIMKYNCEENKDIASKYKIRGYPTLKYFANGITGESIDYNSERSINNFKKFIKTQ